MTPATHPLAAGTNAPPARASGESWGAAGFTSGELARCVGRVAGKAAASTARSVHAVREHGAERPTPPAAIRRSARTAARASASLARGFRAGFTLLEVIVAIAILAVSLLVLVDSQATAVLMTNDTTRILTGTSLAQEKLSEAMLRLEREGFQEGDIEEEGDFEDYGNDGALGEDVEFGDTFAGYRWAYTVRKVDLAIGDMSGAAEQLQQAGFGGSAAEGQSGSGSQEKRDLGDLGMDGSMFGDMLRNYIREVRVVVWWGEEEPDLATCEECVELVTHAINPSGKIIPAGAGP